MDWIARKEVVLVLFKKFRPILLVLLAGIFLMLLPGKESPQVPEAAPIQEEPQDLQDALAKLLSNVAGAGKVEVLLTQAEGEKTVYQTDEDRSPENIRRDTVLVTDSGREETGLVQQRNPPVYLGAVILCQGADNAAVQLSIVKAVMSATGLTSDHITVLKMK